MRRHILLAAFLLVAPLSQAQDGTTAEACRTLERNVERLGPARVKLDGTRKWLVYEDRISRQPLTGVQRLITDEAHWLERCGIVGVKPQRFGMDLPALDPSGAALSAAPRLGRAAQGVHVDLEVELLFNFAIDYPVDWFRDRIAIGPKVKVWWPTGLMLSAQYAFPIRNQLPEKHARYWSSPYPNMLTAGFRRQMNENWIGAVSAGFYERNRYGWDTQLYWISERWPIVLGARAGMTGYWSLFEGEFETGPVKFFTGYLDGTVYLPWYNIRLRGRTGQFIREINQFALPGEMVKLNPGTSGEITRMFGEIEIGLHAFYDGFYVFPGFRFAAPLSPRKGLKRGRIAVYPTRQHYVPYDLGRVVIGRLSGSELTGFIRPLRGEIHSSSLEVWPTLRWLTFLSQ